MSQINPVPAFLPISVQAPHIPCAKAYFHEASQQEKENNIYQKK
jgi:hypothetical protein